MTAISQLTGQEIEAEIRATTIYIEFIRKDANSHSPVLAPPVMIPSLRVATYNRTKQEQNG
jgi:hypothetical protein